MQIPNLNDIELPGNPAQECYDRCVSDWKSLSPEQQAFEKLRNGAIYNRYEISQKYGPQTYNRLSHGGTLDPFRD